MAIFGWFMGTKVGRLLSGLLAAAALLMGVFAYGRQTEKRAERIRDLEKYIDTKKEIDDVEASPDRDAALDRLRRNGWLG